MSERDNESFDLDDEFLSGPTEDGTDYDRLLDRVDKRVRNQGKRGKAAWSKLEEVLADKKLEKNLRDSDEEIGSRATEAATHRLVNWPHLAAATAAARGPLGFIRRGN